LKFLLLTFQFSILLLAAAQPVATNVTIYPSPQGAYFSAQWLGIEPGRSYQLQFSADATHWSPLQSVTNTCSTNAAWVQQTPIGIHAKCFFRIQEAAGPAGPLP
jgi:hypothetical protein